MWKHLEGPFIFCLTTINTAVDKATSEAICLSLFPQAAWSWTPYVFPLQCASMADLSVQNTSNKDGYK